MGFVDLFRCSIGRDATCSFIIGRKVNTAIFILLIVSFACYIRLLCLLCDYDLLALILTHAFCVYWLWIYSPDVLFDSSSIHSDPSITDVVFTFRGFVVRESFNPA